MGEQLRFDGRVAIVTGAGGGLGRAHALLLAARGAKVVVNDLGGAATGGGSDARAADKVVDEIKSAGGNAVANYDSVEAGEKIVQTALDAFGGVDIIVNNAGILRDTSFQKMSHEDWELIFRVHVTGSYRVTRAAWDHMREKGYGRIVFTASAAGIYGNFGQANYAAAKLALVGLSNTLALEGRKKNVLVNTIAPIAGSRLTETVLPKEVTDALRAEYVSPLVAWLAHEACDESGGLFEVGGGYFAKLRWERTAGKLFKLGREISPEAVRDAWPVVTNFENATHPSNIGESMQAVMGNLQSKSKGGNEFIDVDAALGYEFAPVRSTYNERDVSLYAMAIGAAKDPLDSADLQLVYEMHGDGQRVFPTFAVTPAIGAMIDQAKKGIVAPGLNYGFERILHGDQYLEIKRPIPTSGALTHKTRVKDIWDKGKNAVVVFEIRSFDEAGEEIFVNEASMVVRGAGGWGGERGPSSDASAVPSRAPDATITEKTEPNQALLYRLSSGDVNPLHADPAFATAFGFEKPILHGLCTFGFASRHALQASGKTDSRLAKSIKVRFAEPVFPGETLTTHVWKLSDTTYAFQTKVKERDKVVLSNGQLELYTEIPKPKAKTPAPTTSAQPAMSAAPDEPSTDDVFWGIRWHVDQNPDLASRIQTVFKFQIRSPDRVYTLDLKNGKGNLVEGDGEKPDVTLELSDEDFRGMASGKLNPQKLYFGGRLKITGNVMASQKLDFLTKIDGEKVRKAMIAAGRSPGGAPTAAPTAQGTQAGSAPSGEPTSGEVFLAIRDHLERNPDIVAKVATIYQFKLKEPESGWILDVKNDRGSVTAGYHDKPDCTLELSDTDFLAMVAGKADAQKLYFGGKLKISGNVMASQKLSFLMKMDPERAKQVVTQARAAGSTASAPATSATKSATKTAAAPVIIEGLAARIAKTPGLVAEVAAVMHFVVTDPDASFTVDLASAPGTAKAGLHGTAVTKFKLTDDDLAAISKGADVRDLFQRGSLRVDGDVRSAHKLGFLKGLA